MGDVWPSRPATRPPPPPAAAPERLPSQDGWRGSNEPIGPSFAVSRRIGHLSFVGHLCPTNPEGPHTLAALVGNLRLRRLLALCTCCNQCRPSETNVDVGFSTSRGTGSGGCDDLLAMLKGQHRQLDA